MLLADKEYRIIGFANEGNGIIIPYNSIEDKNEIETKIENETNISKLEDVEVFNELSYSLLDKASSFRLLDIPKGIENPIVSYIYADNIHQDMTEEDFKIVFERNLNNILSRRNEVSNSLNINTENLIFVGNSLVEGLRLYSNDSNVFLDKIGISLEGLKSEIYGKLNNYTCDTVVIGMGTNELGYYNEEKFKSSYMDLINKIYSINSNSVIICMSIPPVSQIKSDSDSHFNNSNVKVYSQYIKDICEENN